MDLGALFFGAYRRQVLALLLLHPDESFHLREIARITNTQPGTLRRELALLADAGVIKREKIGNQAHYQANPACPIYEDLRGILRRTAGVADVLKGALQPLSEKIVAAFVYGSVARGDERAGSDLDLMVIGEVKLVELVEALTKAAETLRREINPNVYSRREFRTRLTAGEPFLRRVMDDKKILFIGAEDDLRQLASNRKAQTTHTRQGRD
ncbi:MAG: nucleotidyltransferase domain-containing protein [Gammaproteobacteria bacterium]|nr:nucleotidyltransferase domain-containing protein [Gammaproteobacteria bacterium]